MALEWKRRGVTAAPRIPGTRRIRMLGFNIGVMEMLVVAVIVAGIVGLTLVMTKRKKDDE